MKCATCGQRATQRAQEDERELYFCARMMCQLLWRQARAEAEAQTPPMPLVFVPKPEQANMFEEGVL